jgi:hypothetical protein
MASPPLVDDDDGPEGLADRGLAEVAVHAADLDRLACELRGLGVGEVVEGGEAGFVEDAGPVHGAVVARLEAVLWANRKGS